MSVARNLLAEPLPRRWDHTQGVAGRAMEIADLLPDRADLLESAAWLHDIGYSPVVAVTGFHPLDGARYLRDAEHADMLLCRLVAHHSCASVEASARGLDEQLHVEFAPPPADLGEALTFCDMTTDPNGRQTSVEHRLDEILSRYGADHVVTRSIKRSAPVLIEATYAVERRLRSFAAKNSIQMRPTRS
jgi:hypothetical protein